MHILGLYSFYFSQQLVCSFRLRPQTLVDFHHRFRDAATKSQFAHGFNYLVHKDFFQLNVLDDDDNQPFTEPFVNRLFECLAVECKLPKGQQFRMDFKTFVNVRRLLFHPKVGDFSANNQGCQNGFFEKL
jgi:hypothetical protein